MRKSAWESSNIRNDFEVILGPIFTLFRCCGIDFHELSCNHRLIYRFLMVGWTVLTLGTCGYRLLIQFPSSMMSISLLHWTIEFLNYWIYLLSIFIALRCMARWSIVNLWNAIEDMLFQIPLSSEDVARCRKTSLKCIAALLVTLPIKVALSLINEIFLGNPTEKIVLSSLSFIYFYSWGSIILFVSIGRIISVAFQTIASQLELKCCPPSDPSAVWKYQRQFGIACRAAEEFGRIFGFILFATVSYTFIGFVNVSYNLLKSYQRLPQNSEAGQSNIIIHTVRMTYILAEHLFRLWLICHTADRIRSDSLSIVPVLQNIRNDLYSRHCYDDESEEVHAFILEVSETSPTYEVMGLFTLTKQVIISLIGTTLTYLVVLCQFNAAAEVKSQPTMAPGNLSNSSS